jgi:hypothetical protein
MDATTGLATAKAGIEVGKGALAGWGWLSRWVKGTVTISSPHNRDIVSPGWVEIEGTHKGATGIYWLVSPGVDEYWIKCRITLQPDGRWKESIHIGAHPGPRLCIVSVVWTSEFMHSILHDIRDRILKTQHWQSLKMKPPSNHFSIAQSIVLNVQGPAVTPAAAPLAATS